MSKLFKFESLGLFKTITDGQTDATQITGASTHFSVKYLKLPNKVTFGATTVIRGYGTRRTCMLKATDLV
jgi:hypothetical protein